VLASVPIAYRMRGRFRGKRLLTTILVVPITLGTVLTAEGLIEYLGPTGWLNKVLFAVHLIDSPVKLVNNYWGVLFSLIITGFPFAFLLTLSYLSGIDPTLERAAATLGADWRHRFTRITLPLLAPGLAITFCLSFVLAFSVFPSAYLVGRPQGETRVISIAAYEAAFRDIDYPLGSAIAMIMAVVMLAVIGLVLAWRSTLYRGATGGKG
jgi:putative spermidine/putrescine transport system permease protein